MKLREIFFPKGSSRERVAKYIYHKYLYIIFKISEKISDYFKQLKHQKALKQYEEFVNSCDNDPKSLEFLNDYLQFKQSIRNQKNKNNLDFTPKIKKIIDFSEDELISKLYQLTFSKNENPEVSIIIPTYNNFKLIIECLYSISMNTNPNIYEIIIVFDGTDEYYFNLLKKINNIVLIKNESNLGYSMSCNNGANQANGDYLLFLNDDTQVEKNWLSELLISAKNQENAGIVGPKVIYPNGYLQEAGCSIRNNGDIVMNGYGQDPELPKYCFDREVDYCSGVCLLINKNLFQIVGNFDSDYSPAYYEDTDLSMKIYLKGYKSYFCSRSIVIHHLSATTNDIFKDEKFQLASKNKQKFLIKWGEKLIERNKINYIAFYLPQFHPCEENDLWWGKGFTEWFNVARAKPNYDGHYQPHVPTDLGFYDLRLEKVMEEQTKLAKKYEINGFCYYYYWFSNKRLLDMPLERMLKINKPNFPFCLCWANENWSRHWDGSEGQILIAQDYTQESDLGVIKDLSRYFTHPNYIRIDDKPIILIYRITLFPDFKKTSIIWREFCRQQGIGDILIGFVESFDLTNKNIHPSELGADFSIEFPPHELGFEYTKSKLKMKNEFSGRIFDYEKAALKNIAKEFPNFIRFKTAMPRWDNTPRMQKRAHIFANSSPGFYQAWLEEITQKTFEQYSGDNRIIFLNAWNEWAEGNYLEPDDKYEHEFLNSTKNAKDFILKNY